MPIDQAELTSAVEAIFGRPIDEIKAGLAAGEIAVKRDAARRLLEYAHGRHAAKEATGIRGITLLACGLAWIAGC